MKVTLDHIDKLTDEINMLWFKPEQKVRYEAGQFTQIHLPHKDMDDRGDKRWFTLSSSPSEDMLAITTRFIGPKSSSFKKTLFGLKIGAELNLAEPMGDFVLPKDRSIPLIFIAGGIGITPMRSITKWLVDTNEQRDIKLLYGVRNSEDAVFKDLFEQYGAHVELETTSLSATKILKLIGKPGGKLVYLSGPEPMIEDLFKDLKKHVDERQLITDYFPGYEPVLPTQ